jgi:hypothetical protein
VRGKYIIEVHYHFVGEPIEFLKNDLAHVSTHGWLPKIFTKPLGTCRFEHLKGKLGIICLKSIR